MEVRIEPIKRQFGLAREMSEEVHDLGKRLCNGKIYLRVGVVLRQQKLIQRNFARQIRPKIRQVTFTWPSG